MLITQAEFVLPDLNEPEARQLTIGVITGGRSAERDRSLLSGRTVLQSLDTQGFTARSIDLASSDFLDQVRRIDIAFLAIAGKFAEDGKLQGLLELLGIPYTGSGVLASAIGMDKNSAKVFARHTLLPTLPHVIIESGADIGTVVEQVSSRVGFPHMLKPTSEGGSVGARVVDLPDTLRSELASTPAGARPVLMAEQYVNGRSITVGVLSSRRVTQALPPLETVSHRTFYDYESKRNDALHTYHCPPDLHAQELDRLQRLAVSLHEGLGCIGYSRVDFVVNCADEAYFLEVNTLPGLSRTGNLATMANAGGIDYDTLIRHILGTALDRDPYVP